MASVGSIVARSLRLIAVIDAQEDVNDKDFQTAIEALNAMMVRVEADGLALGWYPVENPSEDIPVPPEAEQAVAYMLAVMLAPEYGTEPSVGVATVADASYRALQRDRAVAEPITQQPVVPTTYSGKYNIYSDDYGR